MTKNEFINFLESSLEFLDSKEKKTVLDFFSEKFSFCSTPEEETAMMEAFGEPLEFIEKLKAERNSFSKKKKKSNELKLFLDSILRNSLPSVENEAAENDLIFSKPLHMEKASEVIHSIEDREVKTLYGEKVVIENRTEPVKEIVLEPIDQANGLTTEEIRIAKVKTLEKTKGFSEEKETVSSAQDENFNSESRIPLEEDDDGSPTPTKNHTTSAKQKEFAGIFNRIIPEDSQNRYKRIALLSLLTLAVSPIILIAFGIFLGIYLSLVSFTFAIVAVLFVLMIALVAVGVVELVHGFLILFDSIPAALIELGFGTILFSFVVAIAALIYEFIFGIVPKWLKWITAIFVRYTKLLYCYLYGGKA